MRKTGLSGSAELFAGGGRQDVRELIAEYLPKQRWFGDKSRGIVSAKVEQAIDLGAKDPAHRRLFLTPVEVRLDDGTAARYIFPLGVATGPVAAAILGANPQAALGRVSLAPSGKERAVLFDAMADDEGPRSLLRLMADQGRRSKDQARIGGSHTRAYRAIDTDDVAIKRSSAQQSNTSIKVGSEYMLKLFRRRSEGVNPDYEIGRFLTEESSFDRVPEMAGSVELVDGKKASTIAVLQQLVQASGDGWDFALDLAKRFLAGDEKSLEEAVSAAGVLGRRTAELHLALGGTSAEKNADFAPEPLVKADLAALESRMRANLDRVLDALEEKKSGLPESMRERATALLAKRGELEARVEAISDLDPGAFTKARCHGDYHLGQVLVDRTGKDFVILDFEGEPACSLAERRAKQPLQKDVAGMMRSFDYAAHAAARDPASANGKEGDAARWSAATSTAFLEGYLGALETDATAFRSLLFAYLFDKAIYEAAYELDNRPDWLDIPLDALSRMAL